MSATGATTATRPKITKYFGDGFGLEIDGGDACEDAAQVICARFPLYTNGAKVPGPPNPDLTVVTTPGAGEDSLADLFSASTTITPAVRLGVWPSRAVLAFLVLHTVAVLITYRRRRRGDRAVGAGSRPDHGRGGAA